MTKILKLLAILAYAALMPPSNASAASFDCTKAKTSIEKSICGDAELGKLDDALSAAYKQALESFPVKGFIRAWQREWFSLVRSTSCKSECAKELIPVFKKRIEQLEINNDALIFASSSTFSTDNPNAVAIIKQSNQGAVMSVWGGFTIHHQFSIDAGKPVYHGCSFNGYMNSINSRSAVEGKTTIRFDIKGNRLTWNAEPEICEGFGRLPDELHRVLSTSTTVNTERVVESEVSKIEPWTSFPKNEQAKVSSIQLGDILWIDTGNSYVKSVALPTESVDAINEKRCNDFPLYSSRDKTFSAFRCYLPAFGKSQDALVETIRIKDNEFLVGKINLTISKVTPEIISIFDTLMQSRYGDPLETALVMASKEDQCNSIDQNSKNRAACVALARTVFPGKAQVTKKIFKKNGVTAESVLTRSSYGTEIELTVTTPEFDSKIKKIQAEDAKKNTATESMSREKAF